MTATRPFVLALAGPPGVGKTTLTHNLARRLPHARVLYYDKYQPMTKLPQAQVQAWFARGGDPNEIDHSEIVADLRRETRAVEGGAERPLLIFETPFGRLHRESGAFIDFLVWIDVPLDVALARNVLAFTQRARADGSPLAIRNFVDWEAQYLINYPLVREMYVAQRARIQPDAELTLDNSTAPEASADILLRALEASAKFKAYREGASGAQAGAAASTSGRNSFSS